MNEQGTHEQDGGRIDPAELWARRRALDARRAGIRAGEGYLYRSGEVLCALEDEDRLAETLRQNHGSQDTKGNEELRRLKVPVSRWLFPDDVDIPSLVRRLRALGDDDWQPDIGVNTVFAGEPRYHGGPGGPPSSQTTGSPWPSTTMRPTRAAQLSVLDTGYGADTQALHAELFDALRPDRNDKDDLDADGDGLLDTQAGHGTFICGLVRQVAPDLAIDPERVLDPSGWGDDLSVTVGLAQQRSGVLNLSFGGYTEDDRPPVALGKALRALGRDVVVVAAAGNNGSDRPFWPAAFKGVIAVAAVDASTDPPKPAAFSNFGVWVDVCAPGVDLLSSYVRGTWQLAPSTPAETFDGWARWSGTSFAAPLVAAEIAARSSATGAPARRVALELLAGLDFLAGAEDYGLYYKPPVDVSGHDAGCD
jgi:subtilisin family serine protease